MIEFDEKDSDVIQLLTQLKNAEGGYPVEMMAARRESYLKQLAVLGVGAGAADALKQASAKGGGSAVPPVASTILETLLIVAIVVEAAAVTIMNRDKVAEFVRTVSNQTTVQEVGDVTEPITITSPQPESSLTSLSPTVSPTATGTPSPELLLVGTDAAGNSEQANTTPDPNGDNGNHYGQTPEPERTKDAGNDTKPKKDPKDK